MEITAISQSRVSTHLAKLREAGLVRDRRDAQMTFYTLSIDGLPATPRTVLDELMNAEAPSLNNDAVRLRTLMSAGNHPGATFDIDMERHYSPGRTWQSLAVGLSALLRLGRVLDVGTGDGAAASLLAPRCESLTCIDVDPDKVAAARTRLAIHGNVTTQTADAHALPFADSQFDAVFLFHTLAYAERPETVVAECARVLAPKGRIVLLSLDQHQQQALTAPYGERHPGFSPASLGKFLTDAGLEVRFSDVACRENKKPNFDIVWAVAEKR